MARTAGTNTRLQTEFIVSLAILVFVALLPLYVTNAYWLGVVVVSMYFAMLAIAWNLLAGDTGQFSLAPATSGCSALIRRLLAYYYGTNAAIGIPAAIIVTGALVSALGRIVLSFARPYLRGSPAFLRRNHTAREFRIPSRSPAAISALTFLESFKPPSLLLHDAGSARADPGRFVLSIAIARWPISARDPRR